jgi:hypothetical protein
MTMPRALPPEFTIYSLAGLRQEWLAWLPEASSARRAAGEAAEPWPVDGSAVAEVDAAASSPRPCRPSSARPRSRSRCSSSCCCSSRTPRRPRAARRAVPLRAHRQGLGRHLRAGRGGGLHPPRRDAARPAARGPALHADAGAEHAAAAVQRPDPHPGRVPGAGPDDEATTTRRPRARGAGGRLQAAAAAAAARAGAPPGAAAAVAAAAAAAGRACWHVAAVAFGADTFRNGMDPLAILNYLRGLGTIPAWPATPTRCRAGGARPREAATSGSSSPLTPQPGRERDRGAFSFVRDDCVLTIEPGATPTDFAPLIEAMPDNPRLGDILVAAAPITPAQLTGLRAQAEARPRGRRAAAGRDPAGHAGVQPAGRATRRSSKQQARARSGAGPARGRGQPLHPRAGRPARRGHQPARRAGDRRRRRLAAGAPDAPGHADRGQPADRPLIEEIRNGTLQLRMVPIGETFSRFRRVVRDTAAELGKDVRWRSSAATPSSTSRWSSASPTR